MAALEAYAKAIEANPQELTAIHYHELLDKPLREYRRRLLDRLPQVGGPH